ncbi:hypothetical protein [Paenibacillus sp. P22]|nr:hypothetical protein [Paenibacillus sp. P22]CDN42926.1 hypothetical protein BN871_CE_00020 [Paenibacillus sp. P22]
MDINQQTNEQDLFIDVLGDMICQLIKEENQRRFAFWEQFMKDIGARRIA